MSNTKYTPLGDKPESVNLPPYELNELNTPEIDPYQEGGSSTNEGHETSQPTPVNEDILYLFSDKIKDKLEKSHSFKIKSSIIEERVFRFHYFPKKGIEGFRKVVENRIEYTTRSSICFPFAIGYFDQNDDLIAISNDLDFLECVHFNLKKNHTPRDIKLITYDIKNHAAVAKEFKMTKKRERVIIGGLVTLPVVLFFFFIGMCASRSKK